MSKDTGISPNDEQARLQRQRQNRRVISGLVVLFIVPVVLAYVAYYLGWFTQATRNHGALMDSPYPRFEQFEWFNAAGEPLHFRDFETQWWWIYLPKSNECDAQCELNMDFLARTHQGMGKRVEKLTRLAIFPNDIRYQERIEKPEQLQLAKGNGKPHEGEGVALEVGKIYAMDVHGNIFMQYEPVTSEDEARMRSKHLRDDIIRVMRNTGL